MSDETGADLRAMLLADTTLDALIDGRLVEGFVPTFYSLPYVWFRRASSEYLDAMDQVADLPFRTFWDVEACGSTPAEALDVADAIRGAISAWINARSTNGSKLGDNVYTWLSLVDQGEEYVIQNAAADAVLHVSALRLEIIHP